MGNYGQFDSKIQSQIERSFVGTARDPEPPTHVPVARRRTGVRTGMLMCGRCHMRPWPHVRAELPATGRRLDAGP